MNPCNTSVIIGRLKDKPEPLNRKDGTQYGCRFEVAVGRNYKNKDGKYDADFIPCQYTIPGGLKFVGSLEKGTSVAVIGPIKTGRYTDEEGKTHFTWTISVDNIERIKGTNRPASTAAQDEEPAEEAKAAVPEQNEKPAEDFVPLEGMLPFD